MPDSWVPDVSAIAKLYFDEELSKVAHGVLNGAEWLVAPDLFNLEFASVAAKRVRRGLTDRADADWAVRHAPELIDEFIPSSRLVGRAYRLAADFGFSAYDGSYLGVAEARGLKVLTADIKLVRLAADVGLSHLVQSLAGAA